MVPIGATKGKKTLRVLKVIVQPVLAIDDGTSLVEVTEDPKQIAGTDWPGYLERFERELAEAEKALNRG